MDFAAMKPADLRGLIRKGELTGPTTGMCNGYAQGNLVVLPKALAEHIVSPVRFTDELAAMQAAGIDTFVEFGPKSVLTGLVKKTLKGVTAKNVENCETLEGVLA